MGAQNTRNKSGISKHSCIFLFTIFYKFAIAIDLYRVLWLQMTGISTQR